MLTKSEINRRVGANIRRIRVLRGMTQRQLADALAALGDEPVTVATVSMWEAGARAVSAVHLCGLADALQVMVQDFIDGQDAHYHDQIRAVAAAAHLSSHERAILRWLCLDWPGDVHGLIEWIGVYGTLAPADRADAAEYLLSVYRRARDAGRLPPALRPYDVDLTSILRKIDVLCADD